MQADNTNSVPYWITRNCYILTLVKHYLEGCKFLGQSSDYSEPILACVCNYFFHQFQLLNGLQSREESTHPLIGRILCPALTRVSTNSRIFSCISFVDFSCSLDRFW